MFTSIFFGSLMIWMFQDAEEPAPEPIDVPALMAQGREAFLHGHYKEAVEILKPAVDENIGEAMLLAADSYYGLQTFGALRRAKRLYLRCIYEDDDIPFPDHSYYQLSKIYLLESDRAFDEGDRYKSRELDVEADFYLGQLLKRHPGSFYRDQALDARFNFSLSANDYKTVLERAREIWNLSTDPNLLSRVEPIIFIEQEPFNETITSIEDTYSRHEEMISIVPDLMHVYATRFEEAGALARASELYLLSHSLWPQKESGADSLLRLADLHRRLEDWSGASFLYVTVMDQHQGTRAEARAALGLVQMLEAGNIYEFKASRFTYSSQNDLLGEESVETPLVYRDLIELIRFSQIQPSVRAEYSYKLALMESQFGNLEQALLIMRNLLDDYDRGPFVGLYRNFYEKLLFTTIDRKFARGLYWDLDRVYQDHRQFLAFTTQTKYPHTIARAYLALNLPSSAIKVYDNMWSYKASISGFDLAFEAPFIDSLELYNYMRDDGVLKDRLDSYNQLYGTSDRFRDRYLYLLTLYESRNSPGPEFLEKAGKYPLEIKTTYDARRLRRIALVAQQVALGALEQTSGEGLSSDEKRTLFKQAADHYALADDLYKKAKAWVPVKDQLIGFWKDAELYQADRLFSLGNYYEAERRYRGILADETFDDPDRDWSFLQIARLHELKGDRKPSLRIYGQIAYSGDPNSSPWQAYASRRLSAIASKRNLEETEKELQLGEF